MTEEEWPTCGDPDRIIATLRERGHWNNRKARLFACACYRLVWDRINCRTVRMVVEKAEERPDRKLTQRELEKHRYPSEISMPGTSDFALQVSLQSLVAQTCNAGYVAHHVRMAFPTDGEVLGTQCISLCEIFGNPFRPVVFAPEWRSDTAVSLAKHIYEARDFSTMPILADALQDAGCDKADVLNHCRDPQQVHVRGCWVVDGVLGKS